MLLNSNEYSQDQGWYTQIWAMLLSSAMRSMVYFCLPTNTICEGTFPSITTNEQSMWSGLGNDSVNLVSVSKPGLGFDPQNSDIKSQAWWRVCNPTAGEAETGKSLGLTSQLISSACLVSSRPKNDPILQII